MVTEEFEERPRGWPFGLGNLNQRLQHSHQQPVIPIHHQQQQITSHVPSSSFSSFSSSNSGTESSASFFQDHSVSLGRLMGMKPMEKKKKKPLYFSGTITLNSHSHSQCKEITERRQEREDEEEEEGVMGQRICVPLLVCILVKIGSTCKSKNQSEIAT